MNEYFLELVNGKYPSIVRLFVFVKTVSDWGKTFLVSTLELERLCWILLYYEWNGHRHTQTLQSTFYWMILLFWMKICSDFPIGLKHSDDVSGKYRVTEIYVLNRYPESASLAFRDSLSFKLSVKLFDIWNITFQKKIIVATCLLRRSFWKYIFRKLSRRSYRTYLSSYDNRRNFAEGHY